MSFDVEALHGRRNDERWNRMAVGDILERMTWSEPDKVAVVADPSAVADPRYASVTYRAADAVANRMANVLLGNGLGRGDRVAMLCENSIEAYLTKLAIAKAGLVALPINTMMAPDVVEHMLRHVEARVAVVDTDLWATGGAAFAAAGVTPLASIGVPPGPAPGFHELVSAASPDEPDVRIHGDDIWEILLTSGTTAMPKAVMVSHTYSYTAAMSHALSYSRNLAVESQLRTCTFLPTIFHISDHAYVLSAFLSGGSVVLGRRPTGASVAAAVTREAATMLWGGSPQFLDDVARAVDADPDSFDLSSLEVIVYGWGAMTPELVAQLTRQCGGRVEFVGPRAPLRGVHDACGRCCLRPRPARPRAGRRSAPPTVQQVLAGDVPRVSPVDLGERALGVPAVCIGSCQSAQACPILRLRWWKPSPAALAADL